MTLLAFAVFVGSLITFSLSSSRRRISFYIQLGQIMASLVLLAGVVSA